MLIVMGKFLIQNNLNCYDCRYSYKPDHSDKWECSLKSKVIKAHTDMECDHFEERRN